jgi:hypothetical protein
MDHAAQTQLPETINVWRRLWQFLLGRRWHVLAVMACAAMALVQWHYRPQPACANDCAANYQIYDLEFAGNRQRADTILDFWRGDANPSALIAQLSKGLWFDFLFAAAYGWLGCLLMRSAIRRLTRRWPVLQQRLKELRRDVPTQAEGIVAFWSKVVAGFWRGLHRLSERLAPRNDAFVWNLLLWLPAIAAVLDCIENIGLLAFLRNPASSSEVWLRLAQICAILKFSALLLALALCMVAAAWAHLADLWRALLRISHALILIRVPLLIVVLGALLTLSVPQIAELFDLAVHDPLCGMWALLASGALGLLVWFSARTLYAFKWSDNSATQTSWYAFGEQGPRWLGAMVPATMAFGFVPKDWDHFLDLWVRGVWFLACLAMACMVFGVATKRRDLLSVVCKHISPHAPKVAAMLQVDDSVSVATFDAWQSLDWRARAFHWLGLLVFVPAILLGGLLGNKFYLFGPLAVILGAAALLVWASTIPIYWAARARVPLLLMLLLVATLNSGRYNDNHAVRLDADMDSTDQPPAGLHYDAHGRLSVAQFIQQWHETHANCAAVYLVSSEGGGIRAAAWTTMVLSELEARNKDMWRCTIAASGVSGGSLGLLAFAAAKRDGHDLALLETMMQTDYLAPVLSVMFGTDPLQSFLPFRLFVDRGQALEDSWKASYPGAKIGKKGSFAIPLAALLQHQNGTLLPALLLNTTVVQTGNRMVQHPFAPGSRCGDAGGECFPGAQDGADWFPAEMPASSAALNSARFTYVSPAGSVYQRLGAQAQSVSALLGQVVDGGYFENSGTVTLTDFRNAILLFAPDIYKKLRVIHLSNDTDAQGFMSNQADHCEYPKPPLATERVGQPLLGRSSRVGNLLAPAIALYLTRDARARQARQRLYQSMPNEFLHFRPCADAQHSLPLGWTLSKDTVAFMHKQLDQSEKDATRSRGMLALLAQAGAPAVSEAANTPAATDANP